MICLEYGTIHCFAPQNLKAFVFRPSDEPVLILVWKERPDTIITGEDAEICFSQLKKHYVEK